MKGLAIYRILGFIVNTGSFFISFFLFMLLSVIFRNPTLLLPFGLLLCIVLYAWFTNKFFVTVLVRNQPTNIKHKDWIKVNAIVALICSGLIIVPCFGTLFNHSLMEVTAKQLTDQMNDQFKGSIKYDVATTTQIIKKTFWSMGIFFIILIVHILWTLRLLGRYRDYFQEPPQS